MNPPPGGGGADLIKEGCEPEDSRIPYEPLPQKWQPLTLVVNRVLADVVRRFENGEP